MKPYWATEERLSTPSPLNLGIGVTANSADDAKALVHSAFGNEIVMLKIEVIQDMQTLEQKHVAPNLEPNWLQRGVWFPAGNR